MFACEQEMIEPDFICLAKGITGGYLPLAATVTTEKVFKGFFGRFDENKTFFHGHTYTGNPVACAAAVENLDLFKRERVIEKMGDKIALLRNELERFKDMPYVGEVRQRGFMVGIELVKNKKTKKPFAASESMGQKVIAEARRRAVIIRPLGDVIVLMPPPAIDSETLKELVGVTYDSIKAATGA
jgi:adenosylmethionine-8-amino-7-oxononanoate aminotransferase